MPRRQKSYVYELPAINQSTMEVVISHFYERLESRHFEETGLPAIVVIKHKRPFFHLCSITKDIPSAVFIPRNYRKVSAGVLVKRKDNNKYAYRCINCGKVTSKQQTKVLDFINL